VGGVVAAEPAVILFSSGTTSRPKGVPRTVSGKIVRSRLVMETPAQGSDVAGRLAETGAPQQ
jgi:acyl-coenzyme A synthetase/AMP-(fatty) acid ligase